MYPEINILVRQLHARSISTFLVTNAQFPDCIRCAQLSMPPRLYRVCPCLHLSPEHCPESFSLALMRLIMYSPKRGTVLAALARGFKC